MKKLPNEFSWFGLTTFMAAVVLLPIFLIIIYAFNADGQTLEHIKATVLNEYIANTLLLVVCVSALSLILGLGSAFLVTFYDFPFSRVCTIALVLPFAIPAYILGFIYSDIFGYFSTLHLFLMDMGITAYFDVLNFYTVCIVLALALYPYVFLIVRASFLKYASTLLQPAINLGMSRTKALIKVVIPLSRLAIVGGLSLVVMETISEYGVVSYYGINTLSTAIFTTWFGLGDSNSAAYISSITMVFVLLVLLVERFSQGRARYTTEAVAAPLKKTKIRGIKLLFTYIFLSIPIFFGFVLPIMWIIYYSYIYAIERIDETFFAVLSNSFFASSIASLFIMLIAIVMAYTSKIIPNIYTKYITRFATLGYSIPGAVVAIGIIILAGDIDKMLIEYFGFSELLLSGTLFILVFGYIVRFLAVGLNSMVSSFARTGTQINKASRNLGKSSLKTLFQVELPLLKNAILATLVLVFIDTIKELPLTLILRPFNYETLATKTYELAVNEMVQESSIYALCIVCICIIPIFFTLKAYK